MALDGDRLGLAIAANFETANMSDAEKNKLQAMWKAIASEIVTEIQTNAIVNTTASSSQACNATGLLPPHPAITSTGTVS